MKQFGRNVGLELLQAFGVSTENVRGFELRCYADELVVLKVERILLEPIRAEAVRTVLDEYRLSFTPVDG